jgi:hypothetical protein
MEKWKPVPGMHGVEASDHGRIRRDGMLTSAKQVLRVYRHRIVAAAWLSLNAADRRYVVKFRRGTSCRLSNLYVCSHAASHERRPARGEACGAAILTENAVREILSLRGRVMQKEIARQFNISRQSVSDIWHGRTWRHVKRPA